MPWIVRLAALAMAAQIQCDRPIALALEGPIPAEPSPVLLAVGGEAVDQHDRAGPAVGRSDVVEGEG